jgi:Fe-S cluster assembly protein SufD
VDQGAHRAGDAGLGMSALLDSLLAGFETLPLRDAAGVGERRRAAVAALRKDGLPSARAERWKYTNLRALERRVFAASTVLPTTDAAIAALPPAPRLVFVNGLFDPTLSDLSGLPEGVTLQPLSQLLAANDGRVPGFLMRDFSRPDEAFARLNAALATEGMVLWVAPGQQVSTPVHLLLLGAPASDSAWHLRHRIELLEGSSLTLIEHHAALGAHAHLSNAITQIGLGAGAQLRHARIQNDAESATTIARSSAVLAADAHYRRVDLELGAALSRHELQVAFEGEGATLQANGVLLATQRRHLDTRIEINHAAPRTRCEMHWRGLGADRGRAVFHGGITIREGADGSDAMLSNKNLLLSEGAEIDTQPVLEIHADEVKAAHGATVGRLDPNALFYLRSRGLPLTQARALLTAAFCREVLDVLDDAALVESLTARLDAALDDLAVS